MMFRHRNQPQTWPRKGNKALHSLEQDRGDARRKTTKQKNRLSSSVAFFPSPPPFFFFFFAPYQGKRVPVSANLRVSRRSAGARTCARLLAGELSPRAAAASWRAELTCLQFLPKRFSASRNALCSSELHGDRARLPGGSASEVVG